MLKERQTSNFYSTLFPRKCVVSVSGGGKDGQERACMQLRYYTKVGVLVASC